LETGISCRILAPEFKPKIIQVKMKEQVKKLQAQIALLKTPLNLRGSDAKLMKEMAEEKEHQLRMLLMQD